MNSILSGNGGEEGDVVGRLQMDRCGWGPGLTLRSHTRWAHPCHPHICPCHTGRTAEHVVLSALWASTHKYFCCFTTFCRAAVGIMVNTTLHF